MHSEPVIAGDLLDLFGEKSIAKSQVDETGAGDFGCFAEVIELQLRNDLLRDVSGGTAELLCERHREICLKIAKSSILGRANQIKERRRIGDESGEYWSESLAQ